MDTLTPATVAELLEDLAQLLPFPTIVYTDMGAESWTPQLYFGPLDESSDLPTHRAGIDADTVRPVWWLDLDTGTILLDEVTLDEVHIVAARFVTDSNTTVSSQRLYCNGCNVGVGAKQPIQ